ncbi:MULTISPECIES: hypothetical protein [unclassified Frondihabitans]|uniref:hypothetical protein n=1 Tax=unclassified Frondihabitans TaxID=2626248 RepID=UPI000F4F715B|nr:MULTISPECIES: hypothetical protein [unclassified Frondihabitans]
MNERISVSWDKLLDLVLDDINPRHEPTNDREVIIDYLVHNESVYPLAADIARYGLSPLETFGGMRATGDIVVLEGNRRLCALMLLHDPSLAPSAERTAFTSLAASFQPEIVEIQVVLFPTREEANVWIERKHQGAANGIGPRQWSAVQQARHFGEKSQNALALRLLDLAFEFKFITADQRSSRVITTVTRYVSNTVFREQGLGITSGRSSAEVKWDTSKALFKRRLERFMIDLFTEKGPVNSRSKSPEREEYARTVLIPLDPSAASEEGSDDDDNLPEDKVDSHEGPRREEARDAVEASPPTLEGQGGGGEARSDPGGKMKMGDAGAASGVNASASPANRLPNPSARYRFFSENNGFDVTGVKLQRIVSELGRTDKNHPLAAAILARVLIEYVTFFYSENQMGKEVDDRAKLHNVVVWVCEDLENKSKKGGSITLTRDEKNALRRLKTGAPQHSYVFSGSYLGAVAHGHGFPEWNALISNWDEIEAIIVWLANSTD